MPFDLTACMSLSLSIAGGWFGGGLLANALRAPTPHPGARLLSGLGLMAVLLFLLALPGVGSLRVLSIGLNVSVVLAGLIVERKTLAPTISRLLVPRTLLFTSAIVGLGVLLLAPVFQMRIFGDEATAWITLVRESLAYDDLPRASHGLTGARAGRIYFGMPSLLSIHALAPLGVVHEGIGRILTLVMTVAGGSAVLHGLLGTLSLRLRWVMLSCIVGLTFFPYVLFHLTWQPDIPFAVLTLLCGIEVARWSEDPSRTEHLRYLAVWYALATFMRQEGFFHLTLLLPFAFILVDRPMKERLRDMAVLSKAFAPGLLLYGVWRFWLNHEGLRNPGAYSDVGGAFSIDTVLGAITGVPVMVGCALVRVADSASFQRLAPHYLCLVALVVLSWMARGQRGPLGIFWRGWWLFPLWNLLKFAGVHYFLYGNSCRFWTRYSVHTHYATVVALAAVALIWIKPWWESSAESRLRDFIAWLAPASVACGLIFVSLLAGNLPTDAQTYMARLSERIVATTEPEDLLAINIPDGYNGRTVLRAYLTPDRDALDLSTDEAENKGGCGAIRCLDEKDLGAQRPWPPQLREAEIRHVVTCGSLDADETPPGNRGSSWEVCALYEVEGDVLRRQWTLPVEGVDLSMSRYRTRAVLKTLGMSP